jgi:hypothetical protein
MWTKENPLHYSRDHLRYPSDQYCLLIAQLCDHLGAQIIANQSGLPLRPREKVLHPVGRAITCSFRQLPAVLALHRRQQAAQICLCPPARLDPPKARPDPLHHCREFPSPALRILLAPPRHLLPPRLTLNSGCSIRVRP